MTAVKTVLPFSCESTMDHTSTPDSSRCCIWLSRRPCRAFSKAPFVVHWIRDPTRHTSKGTYRHGMRLRHKHAVQARETSAGNTTSSWAHTHLWLAVWCSVIWVALSSSVICLAICSIVTCTEHHLMHRAPSHAHLGHADLTSSKHHLMRSSYPHRQGTANQSCDTWVMWHMAMCLITHSTNVRASIHHTLYKGEGMYWWHTLQRWGNVLRLWRMHVLRLWAISMWIVTCIRHEASRCG